MLEKIITYLNLKLVLTGYFDQLYCLCELKVDSDGGKKPTLYTSNGNAFDITDFSGKGTSYWRKNSDVTINFDSNDLLPASGNTLIVNFPLRLVVAVKKSELLSDSNYSEDNVAQTIIKQLTDNTSELRKIIQAKGVQLSVSSYSTDNNSILSAEYSGLNQFDIDYTIAYIALSVNVEVKASKACIQSECEDLDSDILHAFDFCESGTFNRLTETQKNCLISRLCNGCEDATATVNVNGNLFASETIAPGGIETINVPVVNSEDTPLGSISGGNVVIPNDTVNVYVNGSLNQTGSIPAGVNNTINING